MTMLLAAMVTLYLGFHANEDGPASGGPQGRRDRRRRRRAGLLPAVLLVAAVVRRDAGRVRLRRRLGRWWLFIIGGRARARWRCRAGSSSTTGASTRTDRRSPALHGPRVRRVHRDAPNRRAGCAAVTLERARLHVRHGEFSCMSESRTAPAAVGGRRAWPSAVLPWRLVGLPVRRLDAGRLRRATPRRRRHRRRASAPLRLADQRQARAPRTSRSTGSSSVSATRRHASTRCSSPRPTARSSPASSPRTARPGRPAPGSSRARRTP